MSYDRLDTRDQDPQNTLRRAFMGGWTDAISGTLYQTVLSRKTHANMVNLFGWIYGEQSVEFKFETWYRYIGNTLDE